MKAKCKGYFTVNEYGRKIRYGEFEYRQAEAYVTAFKMLVKHMKEGAKND